MHKRLFLSIIVLMFPLNYACAAKGGASISYDIESLSLDEAMIQYLLKYGHRVPLIDLGFAVGELCQAIRNQPLLKDRIIAGIEDERNHGITKDNAGFWEMEDHFFRSRLYSDAAISREYAQEIRSIEKQFPMLKQNNPITDNQIKKQIEEASESYGISPASTGVFNLLIYAGDRVIRIVQDSKELSAKYRRWLSALQETKIFSPWTPGQLLERKKRFILEQFGKSTNGLMRETLEIIRNTTVSYVD